ncbi:LysR family transcriptional regulator [Cryptosporangium sp. NPDC048952]|uniref:LysR family transcriptional regulator n=1 Tax=Cryptosporangium sp. NPDC048952 TaxID=3363961 RepID=UPI00370F8D86
MRSLVAVAETESFASAADHMRTSASSVSRHVASLEKHLGVRLVNRTARSVTLTEYGLQYSGFAQRIIHEIEEEERSLAGLTTSITGSLSVVCPKWLGALELGDAIAAFSVRYPEIELRLELGGVQDRSYAFLDEGYDVSFHTRPLRDSQMRLRRIGTLPFVLCASPSYLDERGRPEEVAALAEHDCLAHEHESSWRLELDGHQQVRKILRRTFTTNSYLALMKATERGRGVALLPLRPAGDSMKTGDLEALFSGAHVQERSLCAVHGPSQRVPKKVEALLDFVTQWFNDHPMPVPEPLAHGLT